MAEKAAPASASVLPWGVAAPRLRSAPRDSSSPRDMVEPAVWLREKRESAVLARSSLPLGCTSPSPYPYPYSYSCDGA